MFRSILVPLDGSDYSAEALPLAETLLRLNYGRLELVMVHVPIPVWYTPEGGVGDMTAFEELAKERELEYLHRTAKRLSQAGLSVNSTLLVGEVSEAIVRFVKERGIDLVVMTTHARKGIPRLWLGSVADRLIRSLHIPVLVNHPAHTGMTPPTLRRILVPLDGSRLAESVLEQAKTIARLAGAELLLVTVVEPISASLPPMQYPTEIPLETIGKREELGRNYLHKMEAQLEAEGFRVQARVVVGRKVSRQIIAVAREEHCDMIVIATHGLGGFDRLVLGSVADQVVRGSSQIPFLVLRPAVDPDELVNATGNASRVETNVPACEVRL